MKIIETAVPGCVVIEPAVHGDERGFFYESWNSRRFAEAVDWCTRGMRRHPGVAELPWLAALASYRAGRPADAAAWARMAVALGKVEGAGADVERIGFHHPPGLYEGPYDVLRFALRALGDAEGAERAERDYLRAKALREAAASPR